MRKAIQNTCLPDSRLLRQALVSVLIGVVSFQQVLQAASPTVPSGGTFSAGTGNVARAPGLVTIRQASSRGIIDWSNFSIGTGGRVLFLNGAGATLNRVTGNQLSLILGSLESTGTIYLINPQGVLIGPNGRIKTGGDFVASTLSLRASSFMAGGLWFSAGIQKPLSRI